MKREIMVALIVMLVAAGLGAQEGEAVDAKSGKGADRDEILAALSLPKKAQALRNKGVAKAEVREALRAARGKKLKAKQTRELLEGAEEAVDESGPIDNFGAFVKSRLAEGLRGRELAAAIRAEHQARGKGKGKGQEKGKGKEKGKGGPKGQGPSKEKQPKKKQAGTQPEGEEAGEGESGDAEDARGTGRGSGQGQGNRGRGRGDR